jgi:predicted Zn-dependent protease
LKSNPGEPGLHEQLADIYWKQNQLEKAEAEFQSELQTSPHSVSVRYKLAVVSLERSKPEIAVDLLREVLRQSPKSLEAHYQLGRGLAQTNAVDEAINNFSYVVSANGPSNTEILRQSYYQLSQLYRRAKKADESDEALQAFLKLKREADATQEQKSQDRLAHSMGGPA